MQLPAFPHSARTNGAQRADGLGAGVAVALAGAVAATAGLVVALAAGAIEVPDAAGALSDASASIGPLAYLFVPLLALLETGAFIGLLVPGETAVVIGGVIAARGDLALPLLIALVWGGAFAGDMLSFFIGRRSAAAFSTRTARACASARPSASGPSASSSATAARRSCSAASSASCAL